MTSVPTGLESGLYSTQLCSLSSLHCFDVFLLALLGKSGTVKPFNTLMKGYINNLLYFTPTWG